VIIDDLNAHFYLTKKWKSEKQSEKKNEKSEKKNDKKYGAVAMTIKYPKNLKSECWA